MRDLMKGIEGVLANEAFKGLLCSGNVQIAQLNAVIALLIKAGIPFDLSYSPGTRRVAAAAELTIFVNPNTTLNFVLNFEGGGSIFGGTPI